MKKEIIAPFFGANDTQAVLVTWLAEAKSQISNGQEICTIETTKAAIEINSEADGYLFPLVEEGETIETGQTIAIVSNDESFDIEEHKNYLRATSKPELKMTKKAELLISKYQLNVEDIEKFAAHNRITEDLVDEFRNLNSKKLDRVGINSGKKIAILGGVNGGGAAIILDSLSRISELQAVAVYDQKPEFHGKNVLGVPVLGTMDRLESDFENGIFDGLVIAFNMNLVDRNQTYENLSSKGFQFFNVIDPRADIRSNVILGEGNIILAHTYIGACSNIGNNNFISANVALEHGNHVGSSCAFGPGVFTSGNVTIGDQVRFGTGIFIEPNLLIDSGAVIGSGNTIITSIGKNQKVVSRATVIGEANG